MAPLRFWQGAGVAFHTGEYDVYVVLTGADAPSPWTTAAWLPLAETLAPFVASPRGKAAVRCTQLDRATRKKASFGRLAWNEASHRKWTHDGAQAGGAPWIFLGAEAWAPAWTQCEKDNAAPDCFVALSTPASGMTDKPVRFGGKLLVALTVDAPADTRAALRAAMQRIARASRSPLAVYQRRPWGRAAFGGFTGAINDLAYTGLFKAGDPHARAVDADSLSETWTPLPACA